MQIMTKSEGQFSIFLDKKRKKTNRRKLDDRNLFEDFITSSCDKWMVGWLSQNIYEISHLD